MSRKRTAEEALGRADSAAAAAAAAKKRFVWPPALHRAFIACIFEVGLLQKEGDRADPLAAEPDLDTLASIIWRDHLSDGGERPPKAKVRAVLGQIVEKLKDYKRAADLDTQPDEGHSGVTATTKSNNSGQSASGSSGHSMSPSAQTTQDSASAAGAAAYAAAAEAVGRLRGASLTMSRTIHLQSTLLNLLKTDIARQWKLLNSFSMKLNMLNALVESAPEAAEARQGPGLTIDTKNVGPSSASSAGNNSNNNSSSVVGLSANSNNSNSSNTNSNSNNSNNSSSNSAPNASGTERPDYLFEMKSHMDLHRLLLDRRNDQLSRHAAGPPPLTNPNIFNSTAGFAPFGGAGAAGTAGNLASSNSNSNSSSTGGALPEGLLDLDDWVPDDLFGFLLS